MQAKALAAINRGFAIFFGSLLICIVLKPHGLTADNGISYYGGDWLTVGPYIFGFTACALYAVNAGNLLARSSRVLLGNLFRLFALLLAGLVITPYSISSLGTLHDAFGTTLFGLQMLLALWFVKISAKAVSIALCFVQLAAGLASLYYLPGNTGYLLETQVIFQLAFWALLNATERFN